MLLSTLPVSSLLTHQHVTEQHLLVGKLEPLILSILESNANLSDTSRETHLQIYVLKQNN